MAQRQCRFIDFLTLPEGDKALANNCALQVSASASARAGVQDSEGCVTLAYCRCLFAMAPSPVLPVSHGRPFNRRCHVYRTIALARHVSATRVLKHVLLIYASLSFFASRRHQLPPSRHPKDCNLIPIRAGSPQRPEPGRGKCVPLFAEPGYPSVHRFYAGGTGRFVYSYKTQ